MRNEMDKAAYILNLDSIKLMKWAVKLKDKTIREA